MKDRAELESMTKDELVGYADEIGAEVSQHWVKDDIIKEIMKAQKAAAKEADKAEPDKPESVKHMEANQAKIKDEIAENDAVAKETAENQELVNANTLPKEGETREQLLARIRKMREAPEPEPEKEVFRSEGLQKEFDAEQKAGKEAVAKAEAAAAKYLEQVKAEAAGEKNPAG
jgi:hypothetical protein